MVERGVSLNDALGIGVYKKDVLCCLLDHAAVEFLTLVGCRWVGPDV